MTTAHEKLVRCLRNEFDEEYRGGFARLKRVPDTQVVCFLDHFARFTPSEQSERIAATAERSACRFSGEQMPPSVRSFSETVGKDKPKGGVRYTGVTLLAGLAKSKTVGGLLGWLQSTGSQALPRNPPNIWRGMSKN